MGVEDSGSNTHNGLLIQNRPLQVPLFPELSCHPQSDLKGTQKAGMLWIQCLVRCCPEILSGWPVALVFCTPDSGVPTIQVGPGTQECPFHRGGTGWAPELGGSPRHYLQTNGSVPASQAAPRCNPVRTGKTSGAPRDSDLALDFPGLGDGRQVTRRHHHGPVGRRSSRHVHTGLPPSPPPLQGPVTVGAQVQAPVSFRQWTVLPCTPLQPSPHAPRLLAPLPRQPGTTKVSK